MGGDSEKGDFFADLWQRRFNPWLQTKKRKIAPLKLRSPADQSQILSHTISPFQLLQPLPVLSELEILISRVGFRIDFFRIPNSYLGDSGIPSRDWDFLFLATSKIPRIGLLKILKKSRVKNPENLKIQGIGIGIWKPRKNPEKSRVHYSENQKSRG